MAKIDVDLSKICKKWQAILRLMDWDVMISTGRYHDLTDIDRFAEVIYSLPKKKATIKILDPDDWDPYDPDFESNSGDVIKKIEESIVHELIHLHIAPIIDNDNYSSKLAVEQTVNSLASSLMKLEYKEE